MALEPENSLPAFERAAMAGVWAIETDVHKTVDGKLVCFHNKKIDGRMDGEGAVAELSFDYLRSRVFTAGNNLMSHTPDELRIPTFEEYLAVCRRHGSIAFIEMKEPLAEEIMREVRRMGMEEYCVFSSAKFDHIEDARRLSDKVFIHHIFSNEGNIERLAELGYSGMSFKILDPDDVPEGLFERVHEAGVRVCIRYADTPEIMRREIDMGVDYVPSNCILSLEGV